MIQPGRRRVVRIVRLAAGLLAAGWVAHYVHYCLTVKPPGLNWAQFEPERRPADDATDELQAAVDSLPPLPRFDPPPPPGQHWVPSQALDPWDALRGPWEPSRRLHLRIVVDYVNEPRTETVIRTLHELRGRPVDLLNKFGLWDPCNVCFAPETLAAHARNVWERDADARAAHESLKTAYWLQLALQESLLLSEWYPTKHECSLLREYGHYSLSAAGLPAEVAADVLAFLAEQPSPHERWRACVAEGRRFELDLLDEFYSLDDDGNGQLMLGAPQTLHLRDQPSRWWNLTGIFFNDRRTVTRKVEECWNKVEAAFLLPYAEALGVLRSCDPEVYYNVVDGPELSWYGEDMTAPYQALIEVESQRRALTVMLALDQYRQRHGGYPRELSALVPGLIDEIPTDPYGSGPFGYRVNADGTYELWSCGPDGVDSYASATAEDAESGDDIVYTRPREASVLDSMP